MKIIKFLLLATVVVSTLGSCSLFKSTHKSINNLENRSWAIYELQGKEISEYATSNNPIYLEFTSAEHRVAGSGGCNRIMGTYTLIGNKLTFGRLATTMMACPDMEMEAKFLKMLEQVTSYQMVDNTGMELVGKDGEILGKFVVLLKK